MVNYEQSAALVAANWFNRHSDKVFLASCQYFALLRKRDKWKYKQQKNERERESRLLASVIACGAQCVHSY